MVSFLPGLGLMKATVLKSMRTLSYFRLNTLNMFASDMPQPLVTWTVSETIIIYSYAHILVSQCIQMLAINSQMYATSVTFMCI